MSFRFWAMLPARVILGALLAAPLGVIAAYSFLTRGAYGGQDPPWTIENYVRTADLLYLGIFLKSVAVAALATALCALLGFPLALFVARSRRPGRWLTLVMLPFWTSFLVRTYAWMFLLRDTGVFNRLLQWVGWTREPLPLLYNDGAVLLGLVYSYLPLIVLPIYATLQRIDPVLLEAAADLGARPAESVWRVLVPLARPGIAAGSVLVFIPCLGSYLTVDLLGGGRSILIGNVIQNQFTSARDWPFGAALALVTMALAAAAMLWLRRRNVEML